MRPQTRLLLNQKPSLVLPWTGATWAIDSEGRVFNTPTYGSELLTDPGIEAWTTATNATSWLETTAGSSTVNQETSILHGGSNALRLDIDSSASNASLRQVITAAVGDWVRFSCWLRDSVASGKTARLDLANTFQGNSPSLALTDAYAQFVVSSRATTTAPVPTIQRQTSVVSHSVYADDASAKIATLATLFRTVDAAKNNADASAVITVLAANNGVQAGIVSHLDSAATPANFLLAYQNGATVYLEKCVAGVYTNLITVSVPFFTDANIEIRRLTGNVFQLFTNGIQRGTDQTVNDAGIIDNTLYGLFATHNTTFKDFRLNRVPVVLA